MKQIEIQGKDQAIEAILTKASNPFALIILAHGAGAGMNHPFMEGISNCLVKNNVDVLLFNFPYLTAGKKFPGSPKPNLQTWNDVVNWGKANSQLPIFIGGKSYGGRMASHVLAENIITEVKGLVYLGFPLHAPGRDSIDRAKHLDQIQLPQLFLQGTRDALARVDLMRLVCQELPLATLMEIEGGDHSFKVKATKIEQTILQLSELSSNWMKHLS